MKSIVNGHEPEENPAYFSAQDEQEPESEPALRFDADATRAPPFAARIDGKLLLCAEAYSGADLSNRETWTGVVLSADEAAYVLEHIGERADETAARIGYKLSRER